MAENPGAPYNPATGQVITTVSGTPVGGTPTGTTPTGSTTGKSVIDHAQIAAAVKDIRNGASELTIEDECTAVMEAFRREVAEDMGGGVPPVWQEAEAWLDANLTTMKKKIDAVKTAMFADAQQLEDFSAAVKRREEEVAAAVQQAGTQTTGAPAVPVK